ncbi:MAG TPA: carboxypeptidase [Vineibacter sp.]|nr:carboxypeptidase [Vineibacter sp.]
MRLILRLALLAVVALAVSNGHAATPDPLAGSITRHSVRVDGVEAAFTATAATLPLVNDKGEKQADIFYVAYMRDDAAGERRPITFVFNGGPGASSAFLHLGALGPRVIDFGPDGQVPSPPGKLVDNPDSWLGITDLVFIDPVGTGYSRAAGNTAKAYWGVTEDLASIASFIDRYLAQNRRQASPKYLVGESYGGFRAARLPELLAERHKIAIAGIVMISPVIEFSLIDGGSLALLPDVLRLPSYAAVALERSATLTPEALADVEQFALGPYLTALAATPRNEVAMRDIHGKVARLTGVPEPVVARHDGRIPLGVFVKEARRTDKLLTSRYDGSVTAPDPQPDSERARGDALFDPLRAVLTSGMTAYLSDTLGIRTDLPYELTNGSVIRQWNWRSGLGGREGHAGASDAPRSVLAHNRAFKVVIAHGMTDLVTPYLTSRYVVDRLPPSLTADRVTLNLYPGGHMMYLRAGSRARLRADAARLFAPSP